MSFSQIREWATFLVCAIGVVAAVIVVGQSLPPKSTQLDRVEAKLDAILSDLHAERAKP